MLHSLPKTKIVCTLGPSTSSEKIITALIESGMGIARLNLSHGTLEEHFHSAKIVRKVSKKLCKPVGIMVDIPGAKYRTGPLGTGVISPAKGDTLTLTSRDIVGTDDLVSVAPPGIHRDVEVGRPVLLDDGLMELRVIGIDDLDVSCVVVRGGRLTERRGVTTPGKSPSQPFPDNNAKSALAFAAKITADFVALSTITSAKNIEEARSFLKQLDAKPPIISKIERAEALDNFDSILNASDCIMVARGDMGVEVRLASVPVIQKDLIEKCNTHGKPVITATQMLESMVVSPVPTRAEVTDVANAIYDGTDAIMLSGETSVGQYPVEAVNVMAEVAMEAEAALPYETILSEKRQQLEPVTDDAISYDACRTANQLGAKLIVALTESGSTAGRVSKYRPESPILALTPHKEIQHLLTLSWGVTPVTIDAINNVDSFFKLGNSMAKEVMGVKPGELVVMVAGLPFGVKGSTNLLRVLTIT